MLSVVGLAAQETETRHLVSVPFASQADLQRLAWAGLDVAGVDRDAGTAAVIATKADLAKIEGLGYTFTIRQTHQAGEKVVPEALSDYTNPEEMSAFLDQVQAAHPDIAKKIVLADSLHEGQKVYAMKITKDVEGDHDRPAFLLDAQHHAREVMTPEVAKDMIGYLTSNYGTDNRVTNWVDNIVIWVVPSVNPDGAMYVFNHDNWWRKNRNPICSVDLNRNYTWSWDACDGSSGYCDDDTYRGATPGSEPETQGVITLMALRPMFNLSYHSSGGYILLPLGCGDPNEMGPIMEYGQALNSILENDSGATGRYATGPGWSTIYTTDGSSDDEAYGKYGTYGCTIEINNEFQPDYASLRDVTVRRQRTAWQFFLDRTLSTPSIQGHVTDAVSGEPLEAIVGLAEVTFTHGEAPRYADSHGRYHWLGEPGKTYHVTYSLPGYVSQTHAVTVGQGVSLQDVALVPTDPTYVPHEPLPADRATSQSSTVTLTWQCTGVTSFDVHFGASGDPPKVATVSSATYEATGLEVGKTYYWKIVANTATGPVSGPIWSFATFPYGITAVKKMGNPFRLSVTGAGFREGCSVMINGTAVPETVFKGSAGLLARGGSALKAMVPKGTSVAVTVQDASGGKSAPFAFSW